MKKTIALIGNPNSGKTLLFNKLTGSNQVVGNWPGVTVEHKSGQYRHDPEIEIIDLPGIYSLSSMSLEEEVTRDYLIQHRPDLIINIIDSTSLERSLYLTTQVMEMNIPMVIALNMIDLLKKRGDVISCEHLEEHFKLPFIEISAAKNIGLDELSHYFYQEQKKQVSHLPIFTNDVEQAISQIEQLISQEQTNQIPTHYLALKLLEQDQWAISAIQTHHEAINQIRDALKESHQEDVENLIVRQRYDYISNMIAHCFEKRGKSQLISEKIDHIVTNRWLAFPIFFFVMWFMYYISIQTIGQFCIDYIAEVVDHISLWLNQFLFSISVSDWLISLITDGILKGVGSIIGFVPQIMILYLFLSILEDSGYMSRIAFIMDRLFMKLGLSGKSFIPMIVGTGCSVPGIMASRTIENQRDRNLTIIMTPFVPCGAKMPVFALIAGALFPDNPWIAPSLYFVAILVIIFSALLLKRVLFKSEVSPFVLELPTYKWPQMDNVLHQVWEKGKGFILKAGTIILLGSMLIWFLGSFNTSLSFVSQQDSMLAEIGRFITPTFSLMGINDWQFSVSILTGFAAKEQIVATLGILLGTTANLTSILPQYLTPLSAYSFLLFILLASPCFSAIATMHKELGSTKWTLFALAYQTGLAYLIAVLFYQIGGVL